MAKAKSGVTTPEGWIDQMAIKRNAMASTVMVCQTTDEERIKEFEAFVSGHDIIKEPDIATQTVYEIDYHAGITQIVRRGRDVDRTPVQVESSGLTMDALDPLLRYIEQQAKSERVVCIIKGVIRHSDILDDFINSVAYSDAWFQTESTAVVFVPDNGLIAPVVRQRTAQIDIPLSTREERKVKLEKLADTYRQTVGDSEIERLADTLSGLNLTNVESALIESVLVEREFNIQRLARVKSEAIRKETSLDVVINGSLGFERVGGYAAHKTLIQKRIINVLKERDRAIQMGIRLPKGILMFGMGGTGKTIFGKAMAKELGLPFLSMKPSDFLTSGIVSESESNMRKTLKTIDEIGACVVFIDEIDSIATQRGASGEMDGGTSRRVFGMLLSWLAEERECIVIATTNRPQDLDEAFRRVGRFDVIIPMLLPDDEARREILRVHTEIVSKRPNKLCESEWMEVVERTRWFNGAEVEELTNIAQTKAFDEGCNIATFKHYKMALEEMRVSVQERKAQQDSYLKTAEAMTTDMRFLDEARATFQSQAVDRSQKVADKLDKVKVQGA